MFLFTTASSAKLTAVTSYKVACVADDGAYCERRVSCVTINVWQKLNDAINSVVDGITLEDLLEWQADLSDQYVI